LPMDSGFADVRWPEMTPAREMAFPWMLAVTPESSASLYIVTLECRSRDRQGAVRRGNT